MGIFALIVFLMGFVSTIPIGFWIVAALMLGLAIISWGRSVERDDDNMKIICMSNFAKGEFLIYAGFCEAFIGSYDLSIYGFSILACMFGVDLLLTGLAMKE